MSKRRRRAPVRRDCRRELAGLLDPKFFKALGDPNRIALLIRLARCGKRTASSRVRF